MRALLVFWAAVLILLSGGAAALQVMGPLRTPVLPVVAAPAPALGWDGRIARPDPALLEPDAAHPPNMLPRVGRDGRLPRQVYARPAPARDGRPRVALLLAGFGLSEADSRAAAALPGPVSLAVSAYARAADPMVEAARAAGHELLASVPMEPERLGVDDPGPLALLTGAPPAANQARLEQVMGRFQGYAGLTGVSDGLVGGRFAGQPSGMSQLTAEVGRRGLFWVDPRPRGAEPPTADMPGPAVDIVLDEGDPPSRAGIEGRLAALERLARQRGAALGVAVRLRPVTLELVGAWARDAEARGIVLVPVSSLVAP